VARRTSPSARPGEAEGPIDPAGEEGASPIERIERQALADRAFAAIRRALGRLPAADRLLLRLHLESGLSLAGLAREWGADQKALYRRRDAIYAQLRKDLEAEGIRGEDAHELLSALDWNAALTVAHEEEGAPSSKAAPLRFPAQEPNGPEEGGGS
jgi:transposase-like protein